MLLISVKELVEEEKAKVEGLVIDVSLDQGAPIEESVSTMVEKALFGGLIAVLIILLFLRDFKSTIISIISIPVSIFMALLILKSIGYYSKYNDIRCYYGCNRSCY